MSWWLETSCKWMAKNFSRKDPDALFKLLRLEKLRRYNGSPHLGVINLPWGRHFYKIEFIPSALEEELRRRKLITFEIEPLFIPLSLFSIDGLRVASLRRMEPIKDMEFGFSCGKKILEKLASVAAGRVADYRIFPELELGLVVLSEHVNAEVLQRIKTRLAVACTKNLLIGPVHGDFHLENILLSNDNEPLLIDCDCFRPAGMHLFDILYFAIELSRFEKGIRNCSWLEELDLAVNERGRTPYWLQQLDLADSLMDLSLDEAYLFFFVDRLGQDVRFYSPFLPKDKAFIEQLAQHFAGPEFSGRI